MKSLNNCYFLNSFCYIFTKNDLAFIKELSDDMDKFQNTSISIITKVVRHNWKLIPTRIGIC